VRTPPLLLRPLYVHKPWGGRRLADVLGRDDLPDGPVGESWEVADLPGAASVVDGGPASGRTLREVRGGRPFPLLVKVLDAREALSVQVHPDGRDGTDAKEEAWAALADGGEVATGPPGTTAPPRPEDWLARLRRVPLRAGTRDGARPPTLVHVPAGTVHAILAGALVWEVQTPVDVTWRLWDHGRTDSRGVARALHVDDARAVLARGPEQDACVDDGGRRVRGRRFVLDAHPPGDTDLRGASVAFFAETGAIRWRERAGASVATLDVPRGRTVVLDDGPVRGESDGWVLTASVL
jgi:mannose-6-phosphate isomerase